MLISYYANKKSSPRLPSWQPSLISFNTPIDSGSIIKPCTLKHFQVPILAPGLYSKVQICQISRLLLWKSPQECQNVTIEFCFIMRIFYELRYTVVIKIVWTFYLKNVPAKFQKYLKHISWVISETSSSKLSCNPRHLSRNISCNHRHHLLQPSWRRMFSTSNNQKTRVDSTEAY